MTLEYLIDLIFTDIENYILNLYDLLHSIYINLNNNHLINLVSFSCLLPCKVNTKKRFASYLAGLIEGDGSIITPKDNITSYRPFFEIVFHIDDLPLAEIIQGMKGN